VGRSIEKVGERLIYFTFPFYHREEGGEKGERWRYWCGHFFFYYLSFYLAGREGCFGAAFFLPSSLLGEVGGKERGRELFTVTVGLFSPCRPARGRGGVSHLSLGREGKEKFHPQTRDLLPPLKAEGR